MKMIARVKIHIGKDRNFEAALFSLKGHSRRKYAMGLALQQRSFMMEMMSSLSERSWVRV